MLIKTTRWQRALLSLMPWFLVGCMHPPFNDFKSKPAPAVPGYVIKKFQMKRVIKQLKQQSIEVIHYGNKTTILIPTDRYFVHRTAHLNEICYSGLNSVIRLINLESRSMIYVAVFTDNVTSHEQQNRLSQAQAETMLTFLWANHIPAERLKAEGYGMTHSIASNKTVHSSAFNRRIELQFSSSPCPVNLSAKPQTQRLMKR